MNMRIRQLTTSWLLPVVALFAVSLFTATSATADDDHPAQKQVISSTMALIDILKTEGDRIKEDKAYLDEQIVKHVVPNVDFNTMTKLAVGKSWKQADKEQRVQLVDEFTVVKPLISSLLNPKSATTGR